MWIVVTDVQNAWFLIHVGKRDQKQHAFTASPQILILPLSVTMQIKHPQDLKIPQNVLLTSHTDGTMFTRHNT